MKNHLLILLLMSTLYAHAQDTPDISGTYDRGQKGDPQGFASLFVMKDHTFAVVFFGGGIFGSWKIEKGQVLFTPKTNAQTFALYGRHNPDLTDSTRIAFMAFAREDTFINLGSRKGDTNIMKRVFNLDANCNDFPNVMKFKGAKPQISFVNKLHLRSGETSKPEDTYTFQNAENFNDFIAYHYPPSNNYRPFSATVKKGGLLFRDDDFAKKGPLPTRKEDLQMLNTFKNIDFNPIEVQFNPYYGGEDGGDVKKDALNYTYNAKKNAWISPQNYTEGEEYKKGDDAFNQRNIIYVFKALKPIIENRAYTIDEVPLFTRRCAEDK